MTIHTARRWMPALLGALVLAQPVQAEPLKLKLSGDVRLRLERDWGSVTATGLPRADRTRSRIRARLVAKANLADGLMFTVRARTGGKGSQQNANITFVDFSGNRPDPMGITLDQFEVAWKGKNFAIDAGRMPLPFYTQNEYLWDGDIDPLGLATHITLPIAETRKLGFAAGMFAMPVGLANYSGQLAVGQLTYADAHANLALGLFHMRPSRTNPNRLTLLDGNGLRIYSILAASGHYRSRVDGVTIGLGVDLFRNLENYDDPSDPIGQAGQNQRTGYVLSASLGDNAVPDHLQVGYRYLHIERLAVNASYSHDDVSRLGSLSQAANTDLAGHDIYANFAISKRMTIGARMMLVHRLTDHEDAKRARVDLIYSF